MIETFLKYNNYDFQMNSLNNPVDQICILTGEFIEPNEFFSVAGKEAYYHVSKEANFNLETSECISLTAGEVSSIIRNGLVVQRGVFSQHKCRMLVYPSELQPGAIGDLYLALANSITRHATTPTIADANRCSRGLESSCQRPPCLMILRKYINAIHIKTKPNR